MIHSLPKRMKSQYSEKVLNFEISKKKKEEKNPHELVVFLYFIFQVLEALRSHIPFCLFV